ncbi:hypothetical protein SLS62_002048 [Diatrype stigma]|uniref:ribonuclease H n=1 Tax=Diatrype stigma TaxID=117547 RepID=A0AAN9UVA9_9PEZI
MKPARYSSPPEDPDTSESPAHDQHAHHRAGNPGETCQRFPRGDWYGDGDDNLEVRGADNFMHVRCPFASPTACRCGRYACHLDSLVIAVDGACPGNGAHRADACGCGVYFGPRGSVDEDGYVVELNEQRNLAFEVSGAAGRPHTSQRAELRAAIAGLCEAKKFAADGGQWPCKVPGACPAPCPVRHLVVKSDSAYMVNSMTGSAVRKWLANGWRTAKRTSVQNRDLWEALLGHVADYTALGTAVDFWLVPRAENAEADRLANEGLYSALVYTPDGLRSEDWMRMN